MNKIRVLHILSDTNIGGAGRLLFNLSQSIDKSKFEFIFVFPKGSKLIKMFKNQYKQRRSFLPCELPFQLFLHLESGN